MKLKSFATVVLGFFGAGLVAREPLNVGDAAPAVTVTLDSGESVEMGELFKSGLTLVYFYPKADTPGCTAQACSLRDAYADLGESGVRIFGVSMDSVQAQAAFREKYSLPFSLVADVDGTLVNAFGVPARMNKFAARQAFLIKDGKVVWRDLSASTAKQAEDVKAALASL